MYVLGLTSSPFLLNLTPKTTTKTRYKILTPKTTTSRKIKLGKCRAEFSGDAPVAVAISACILNSLVFPVTETKEDDDGKIIESGDARFAVMGIISFIPFFNWMSWVFAWLDTGRSRYAVYAIVYLAPYLRSNLSISPEESWIPITSILLCILHIQIEASINNGDLQGFKLFNEIASRFSSSTQKKDSDSFEEVEVNDFQNLPSAQNTYRDEIEGWNARHKSPRDNEILKEDEEDN